MEVGKHLVRRGMIFIYTFYGLWRTANTSKIYHFYGYGLHTFFTLIYTITMCAHLLQLKDVAEVIAASGMAFTLVALTIKVLNLYYFLPTIQEILKHCEEFRVDAQAEAEVVAIRFRVFAIMAYAFFAMANTAGSTQYVSGWWTRQLPFPARFPWIDVQKNFVLLYVYQVLGMLMMSAVAVVMELFPSYLMCLLSIQTEVICMRLEKLATQGIIEGESNKIKTTSELQLVRVKSLRECLIMHQQLCR